MPQGGSFISFPDDMIKQVSSPLNILGYSILSDIEDWYSAASSHFLSRSVTCLPRPTSLCISVWIRSYVHFSVPNPSSMLFPRELTGTPDFASELQKNLQKALPFENLAVDECAKHLIFFPLKVTGSTTTQRKSLDKQGTALWNLCRNSDSEETEAAANARCHGSFIVRFNLGLRQLTSDSSNIGFLHDRSSSKHREKEDLG